MPNEDAELAALANAAMDETEQAGPSVSGEMTDQEVADVVTLANGLTAAEQKRIEDILNEDKPTNYDELFAELKSDEVAKLKFCRVMKIDVDKLDALINMSPAEREMTTGMKTMLRTDIQAVSLDGFSRDWKKNPDSSFTLKNAEGKEVGVLSRPTKSKHQNDSNWIHYTGELGEFDYDSRYFEISTRNVDENDPSKGYITFLHATKKVEDKQYLGPFSTGTDCAVDYITHEDGESGLLYGDYLYAERQIECASVLPDTLLSAHGMYANCSALENLTASLDSHNGVGEVYDCFPSKIEDVSGMFYKCENIAWKGFNVKMPETVVDARSMFNGCAKLENCPDFSRCEYLSPNLMAGIYNDTQLVMTEQKEDEETHEMQNIVKLKDSAENGMPKYWRDARTKNALMESKGFEGVNFEHIQGNRERYSEALVLSATSDYAQAVYAEVQNSVSAGTHGLADSGIYTDENGNTYSGITELNQIKDKEVDPLSKFFSKFGLNFSGVGGIGAHLAGGAVDYVLLRAITGSKVVGIAGALGLQAVGSTQDTATPLLSFVTKLLPEGNSLRSLVEDLNAKFHATEEDVDASNYKANLTASVINTSKSLDYGTIRSAAGPEVMAKLSQEMVQNGTLSELATRSNEDLKQVHNTMATTLDTCLASFKGGDIPAAETYAMTKEYLTNVVASMKYYQAGVYDHSVGLIDRDKCLAGAQKYVTAMEVPLYDHIIKAQEDSKVMGTAYGDGPMFSDAEWAELCAQTASIGQISLGDYYENYYKTGKSYIEEFYVTQMDADALAQASLDDYDEAYSLENMEAYEATHPATHPAAHPAAQQAATSATPSQTAHTSGQSAADAQRQEQFAARRADRVAAAEDVESRSVATAEDVLVMDHEINLHI